MWILRQIKQSTLLLLFFVCFSSRIYAAGEDSVDFRINPLVVLLGGLTFTMDFKIHPQWTLGPELGFVRYKFSSDKGSRDDTTLRSCSVGARATWFRNGVFTDGLYVGPFATYANAGLKLSDSNEVARNRANSVFAGAVVGYGWFWESFNVLLGGGLTLPIGKSKVDVENSTGNRADAYVNGEGIAILEFSLGWSY